VAKRIAPERLWQDGKWLLVPMQDEHGKVQNVQAIGPNGASCSPKARAPRACSGGQARRWPIW
jgi:hypothetical protein